MLDYGKILLDGGIAALVFTLVAVGGLAYSPRLFLNKGDYPDDVLAAVPPKTEREQRQAVILGLPLLVFMIGIPLYSGLTFSAAFAGEPSFWLLAGHIFLVLMVPFLWDLIVLDWLVFCTITPSFVVIPGTEGFAGYKDYLFHLKGHTKGLFLYMIPLTLLTAGIVSWIRS